MGAPKLLTDEIREEPLAGRLALDIGPVDLPVSRQRYWIAQPTNEERDRLFAEAKSVPGQPLPHWAKVWPSGVALADLALTHSDELRGRQVLELGSGLGVTATATLQAGADLVAVDVSPLALSFCQYNTQSNVGRSPLPLCANWRDSEQRARIRATAGEAGFPVILAADVLYESGDIPPLLNLIHEVLAPNGILWLAEPGRKTAERFLYALAVEGWQGISEEFRGPWPDGSAGLVAIHRLRRPTGNDLLWPLLGGWLP